VELARKRQAAGTGNRIFTQTYGEENVPGGEGVDTQLLDSTGNVERTIAFNEANRKLCTATIWLADL
jgi:hypothetical protein